MTPPSQERQLQLALQAIQNDPYLSIRAATNIFGVPQMTLSRRLRGITSQRDRVPLNRNLTELEELTIVQYILELDSRAFPPRLCEVEDMANRLLADRDAPSVGKRWASNFVKATTRA